MGLLKVLGIKRREPYDIRPWVQALLKAFPETEWDVREQFIDQYLCFDMVQKVYDSLQLPVVVRMNDCSGVDIYKGEENIAEQETDVAEMIAIIKGLLSSSPTSA